MMMISNRIRRTKGVVLAQRARHSEGNSIHTSIVVQHTHVRMYTRMNAPTRAHPHSHTYTHSLPSVLI